MSGAAMAEVWGVVGGILAGLDNKGETLDPDYMKRASEEVSELGRLGRPFTSETVLERIGHSPRLDPRTIGVVMKRAQRDGIIRQTGGFTVSKQRHGAPLREWVGAR